MAAWWAKDVKVIHFSWSQYECMLFRRRLCQVFDFLILSLYQYANLIIYLTAFVPCNASIFDTLAEELSWGSSSTKVPRMWSTTLRQPRISGWSNTLSFKSLKKSTTSYWSVMYLVGVCGANLRAHDGSLANVSFLKYGFLRKPTSTVLQWIWEILAGRMCTDWAVTAE